MKTTARRILLLEADDDLRQCLIQHLSSRFEVHAPERLGDVMQLLFSLTPNDVVVVGVDSEKAHWDSEYRFVFSLRKNNEKVPLIFLVRGYPSGQQVEMLNSISQSRYLIRPFGAGEFELVLDSLTKQEFASCPSIALISEVLLQQGDIRV